MMRNLIRLAALLTAAGVLVVACAKVPYTGRIQYNVIPDSLMRGIGKSAYNEMLSGVSTKKKGDDASTLNKVGRKISKVADKPKYDWKFTLIKEDVVNAWCLPGGYIGFYTGVLPALRNEAGMAFVMGHEVGHATAHHGAERMTQSLTMLGGLVGLELYLKNKSNLKPKERGLVLGALGVGATVGVILPFSRAHEAEADVIGMMYMAKAGYPPAESIKVWDRFEKESNVVKIPAILSTHPATQKRQANQKEWLPKARKRYLRNKLGYDTQEPLWGKGARKRKNAAADDGGSVGAQR
jgi:predicted Zn-dependent protease